MPVRSELQKRARRRHLLSYLCISLVPILICGMLVSVSAYRRRTEQRDAEALSGLETYSKLNAALLSGMDMCTGHLEGILADKTFDIERLPDQLALYQTNNALFEHVFYYKTGSDSICTQDGVYWYEDFEKEFLEETGVDLTMTKLFTGMNNSRGGLVLRSRSGSPDRRDGEYLFYICTVPVLSTRPDGVAVYCVSASRLLQLLAECIPDGYDCYYYYDRYLNWLAEGETENTHTLIVRDRLEKMGTRSSRHEGVAGREYLLLRVRSERDDTYHMLAYDTAVLYAEYRGELRNTALILLTILLPTALLAYILHRRMFTPIGNLLELPLPENGEPKSEASPEKLLDDVARRAMGMIRRNEELEEQVEDQRLNLRTQAMFDLLTGGTSEEAEAELRNTRFPLLTVLYIVTDALEENSPLNRGLFEREMPYCRLFIVPLRKTRHFAVICAHEKTDTAELMREVLSLLDHMSVRVLRCGVGAPQEQTGRVHVSFAQAQAVIRTTGGGEDAAVYSPDADPRTMLGFPPVSEKLLLCQCIRGGNTDIALSTLHRMQSDAILQMPDRAFMRSWCFFLYETVESVLRELHMEDLSARVSADDILDAEPEEFLNIIETLTVEACGRVKQSEERRHEQKQNDILNYVDSHFADAELSLSQLSAIFEYSESFITRMVKQTTGMSFLQYVTSLRMERVKRQLRETDLPVKEIAANAGYVDIASFTRRFRQIEGVTPGQYRERGLYTQE